LARSNKEFRSEERESFFAPGFFVDIRERNLAIAGVDAVDSGLAFSVKVALRGGTVREFDLVLFAGDGFAGLIEKFDFNPVTGLGGRTCRLR
jgi:hypothetical protein